MRPSDLDQAIFDSVTPSDLGPVFTEYKNNPEGAIKRLMAERTGDARAVVERGDIGTIDLIYGNSKGGLAHIAMKHPEIIGMLPSLLRNGKLVKKPGARKVFLISERDPADVVVVALDWYGAAKTWVVTSYVDERGVFTGSTKRIDTDALDSAWVEVLYAGQWTKENTGLAKAWVVTSYDDHKGEASGILASVDTKKLDSAKMDCRLTVPMLVQILGHDMNSVNTFDNASPLSALERLKLVKRLLGLRTEASGLGAGGAAAMRKLKIAREMIDIRQKLGLGGNAATQEPQATGTVQPTEADGMQATTPEPKPEEQNPHVKALRDLAAGKNDGQGLEGMFNIIQEATNALEAANLLTGDNEAAANAAITHWAEFEERLNG